MGRFAVLLIAFTLFTSGLVAGCAAAGGQTNAPNATDTATNETMTCRDLKDGVACDLTFVADDD